jgi:hypothetical protein
VLLAGEVDQYANLLPQILEKIVEALRLPAGSFSKACQQLVKARVVKYVEARVVKYVDQYANLLPQILEKK